MLINVPVYTTQNNTHFINIYAESDDGTFHRTQSEPLRLLRDDIAGITLSQGELVSHQHDRHDRLWSTATVTFHYGRPQSFYQFLREKVAQNKFFVFSKPSLSGHIIKFDIHELKFKTSMSQRKLAILKEKYLESLALWSKEDHDSRKTQEELAETVRIDFNKTQKFKLVKMNPHARSRKDDQGKPYQRRSSDQDQTVPHIPLHMQDLVAGKSVPDNYLPDNVIPFNGGDYRSTNNQNASNQRASNQNGASNQNDSNESASNQSKKATFESSLSLEPITSAPTSKQPDANPANKKPNSRHSHFLRRFLFRDS